ncbi:MAG: hypothetical protein ACTHOB_04495 [Ginsengibacter sp.]
MKLWQKNTESLKEVETFTVGKDRELDMFLARYDVLGSLAHIKMLEKVGLLSSEELHELEKALKEIYTNIIEGNFCLEEGVEDIHSQVEFILTKKLGDAGKKLASSTSIKHPVKQDN